MLMLPVEILEIICRYVIANRHPVTIKNFALSSFANYCIVNRNIPFDNIGKFLSWDNRTCLHCHKPVRNQGEFYSRKYYVCHVCCNEKYNVISMTKAKQRYKITEDILRNLPRKLVTNPRRRRNYITFYLEQDVFYASIKN